MVTHAGDESVRFRTVAIFAGLSSALVALGHFGLVTIGVEALDTVYWERGGAMPAVTQWFLDAEQSGLLLWLTALVDVAVFAAMLVAARRVWIGLLLVPLAVYFAMFEFLVVVFALPLYQVIH